MDAEIEGVPDMNNGEIWVASAVVIFVLMQLAKRYWK